MVKVFDTCVDDALKHLSIVEKFPRLFSEIPSRYQVMKLYQATLRNYRMIMWCIPDCDADMVADFNDFATSVAHLFEFDEADYSFALTTIEFGRLLETHTHPIYQKCNALHVSRSLRIIFRSAGSFEQGGEPFTSNETMEFLDSVHAILNGVVKYGYIKYIPNLDTRIESLVEPVFLLRNLVYYTSLNIFECIGCQWAYKVACVALLRFYARSDGMSSIFVLYELDASSINPCYAGFIKLCFQVIECSKMKRREETLVFGEFVSRFVDFFLENLILVLNDDDDFQEVREGLIFLITFLADPPSWAIANAIHSELILPLVREQIHQVLDQASNIMCFYSICETNLLELPREGAGKTNLFYGFLKSIDEVKGDIVNLYVPPWSWTSDFPRTDKLGYFDGLLAYLENLKEMMNKDNKLVPFLKHTVVKIHQELLPLRLPLSWMMQNEHIIGFKDIWEEIMSLFYQADFAIKSSFFIDDPIWYNLTRLSLVITKIKDIRYKVRNIQFETQTEGSRISETEAILPLMSSIQISKPSTTSTSMTEVVVGFEKETKLIIDLLVCESKSLDLISIVGMGGLGKTTLAKLLYNNPIVKNHFHNRAFCSVSQLYKRRNVLLHILNDLSPNVDGILQMSDDDLAQRVRQSLLKSRYLIVLDDVWDVKVWDDLKPSFPDDCYGSRVIFTTRINNLLKSTHCPLQLLSTDESWELLSRKVFHKDPCPTHLVEVGKGIAKNCRGLPLSIVVIAGLLARTERSLAKWKEVAETPISFALSEGCRDIIELSYKHLPDALKSCFLYLGAFCEDYIRDKRTLPLLWVAEGFVFKSRNSCALKTAKKYLNDLGDWNLVTATRRSYNGGIKRYSVHDLIHDFCRTKAQEEHLMCYTNEHNKSFPTMSSVLYDQYRINIEAERISFVNAKHRGSTVRSLLCFCRSYLFTSISVFSPSEAQCQVNTIQSFLCNFKLVQVLNLFEFIIVGDFPTMVTTLVHLRYLALQFSDSVYVPPDISNLLKLETLLLQAGLHQIMLPYSLGIDVKRVKVLEAHTILKITAGGALKSVKCEVRLPSGIWEMKSLMHVEVEVFTQVVNLEDATGGVSSPQLPELITFGSLFIPYGIYGEELLRKLSNVRKFSCLCRGTWNPQLKEYELPNLEILTKLESLSIIHLGADGEDGYNSLGSSFKFSFPSTIRKLTLKMFYLPWNEFSATIRVLQCLEVLVLQYASFTGREWDVENEEFPSIKSLTLDSLDIEVWKASTESFPALEKLFVNWCFQLDAIPPCFSEVQTLMCIRIDGGTPSLLYSAIQIQEDLMELGTQTEVRLGG